MKAGSRMSSTHAELRDRISKVLGECVIEARDLDILPDIIIAAIKWDHVIVSTDEYQDIREMCRAAINVASAARELA